MADNSVVTYSASDGVGRIVFDRAPANAYDLEFHRQFDAAVAAATADKSARVVMVQSAVPRFFCAGADVKAFAANSTKDNQRMVAAARKALAGIEASDKPFIAVIEGHALGGGLEIAMACDIRIAAAGDYKLGLPEAQLGLLPGNGGSQRLPRLVGKSQAMLMLAGGDSISPAEACRIGLLDRLVPCDEFEGEVAKLAVSIAQSAPLAVAAAKRALREGLSLPLQDGLALEAKLVDELYDTEDANEGFAAAREKRTPTYKGQ